VANVGADSTTKMERLGLSRMIIFNKPYRVLSQFTDRDAQPPRCTLANFLNVPEYRAAGRLDYDSEGLLLLTDDGRLQQRLANPKYKQWKTYWVQVEGKIDQPAIDWLCSGVQLKDGSTLPAKARIISKPESLWPRQPPVRYRSSIPDSWIELKICEGRNRQVRRMTAAVGFPTLRLIRSAIAEFTLDTLQPGEYRYVDVAHLSVDSVKQRATRGPEQRPEKRNSKRRPAKGRQPIPRR